MPDPEWLTRARDKGLVTGERGAKPMPGRSRVTKPPESARSIRVAIPECFLPEHPKGKRSSVDIPVPPSTNKLFVTRKGRRFKSPEYRAWLRAAVPMLRQLASPDWSPFGVRLTLFDDGALSPHRDIDNIIKPVLDCLVKAGVIRNDSIAAGLHRASVRYCLIDDGSIPGGRPVVGVQFENLETQGRAA